MTIPLTLETMQQHIIQPSRLSQGPWCSKPWKKFKYIKFDINTDFDIC